MLDDLRKLFRTKSTTPPVESTMFEHHSKEEAGPFCVTHDWTVGAIAECHRLADGRLQLHRPGSFPELLTGHNYIVGSRALAEVLRAQCGHSIDIAPARIVNIATEESFAPDHFELLPHSEITVETLHSVDTSTSGTWHFRKSHLFVTKDVVVSLLRAGLTSLRFENGFRGFTGL